MIKKGGKRGSRLATFVALSGRRIKKGGNRGSRLATFVALSGSRKLHASVKLQSDCYHPPCKESLGVLRPVRIATEQKRIDPSIITPQFFFLVST